MRDLTRRVLRIEQQDRERSVVLIWKGPRPATEVMTEAFGSPQEPPGLAVCLLCWGDEAEGAPVSVPLAPPETIEKPAGSKLHCSSGAAFGASSRRFSASGLMTS